jgi:hypothetical protein
VRVGLDIVGLSRFSVGVEDEVDATVLLCCVSIVNRCYGEGCRIRTLAARAMHLE